MATVTRKCPKCSRRFKVSNQSRRQFCEPCRPPRLAAVPDLPPEQAGPGEVEVAVRAELVALDRVESVMGVLVLRLAQQLDRRDLTGGQASALARQIEVLVDSVRASVPPAEDFVDEMARRRREREAAGDGWVNR